jgi:hypothetical protein
MAGERLAESSPLTVHSRLLLLHRQKERRGFDRGVSALARVPFKAARFLSFAFGFASCSSAPLRGAWTAAFERPACPRSPTKATKPLASATGKQQGEQS